MKGYVVCVYENIKDQEILKDYAVKAKDAVDIYRGNFLVRGGNKITTEGKEFIRTVVIEFDSKGTAILGDDYEFIDNDNDIRKTILLESMDTSTLVID